MNNPIVVGVDPVHEDREPLAFAARLAEHTGAPLIAVAAYPAHKIPSRIDTPQYNRIMRGNAESAIDRAAASLPAEARTMVVGGQSAARALHDALAELDAGLLVLGSAHRGAIGRVVVGSVADRMLHGAGCAVAIVPRGYEAPPAISRLGVAFVDTPEGRSALAAGAALAARSGAVLDVVTAVPPIDWSGVPPQLGEHPQDDAAARVAAERTARAALEELAGTVEATVTAVGESIVGALVWRSAGWDILVCGSRGYGPLRTVLLGSVSRSLSHEAQCPLLVLPRGLARTLGGLLPDTAVAEA
jgi:nucleotide-binding universal stress UspA family protein